VTLGTEFTLGPLLFIRGLAAVRVVLDTKPRAEPPTNASLWATFNQPSERRTLRPRLTAISSPNPISGLNEEKSAHFCSGQEKTESVDSDTGERERLWFED
jgi:hypothetical protein